MSILTPGMSRNGVTGFINSAGVFECLLGFLASTFDKTVAWYPQGCKSGTVEPLSLGVPAPHLGQLLILVVPPCVCDMGPTRGYYEALIKQSVRKSHGSNQMGVFKAHDKNDQSVSQKFIFKKRFYFSTNVTRTLS